MRYKEDLNSSSWSPLLWVKASNNYLNIKSDLCGENHLKGTVCGLWSSFSGSPAGRKLGKQIYWPCFFSLYCWYSPWSNSNRSQKPEAREPMMFSYRLATLNTDRAKNDECLFGEANRRFSVHVSTSDFRIYCLWTISQTTTFIMKLFILLFNNIINKIYIYIHTPYIHYIYVYT